MWKRWGHLHGCHAMGGGCPPLPIKGTHFLVSSHTSSRRISLPPLEFPHGLGSARYMFLVAFLEGFVASAASLERGRGGCRGTRTCVRSRMRHCFAVLDLMVLDRLDQMDFIMILRLASVRLHHP